MATSYISRFEATLLLVLLPALIYFYFMYQEEVVDSKMSKVLQLACA